MDYIEIGLIYRLGNYQTSLHQVLHTYSLRLGEYSLIHFQPLKIGIKWLTDENRIIFLFQRVDLP